MEFMELLFSDRRWIQTNKLINILCQVKTSSMLNKVCYGERVMRKGSKPSLQPHCSLLLPDSISPAGKAIPTHGLHSKALTSGSHVLVQQSPHFKRSGVVFCFLVCFFLLSLPEQPG